MNVTIIGTGNMARGIGSRLVSGGHRVTVLGKEVEAAEEAGVLVMVSGVVLSMNIPPSPIPTARLSTRFPPGTP
jgi:predicted dinucleotide-binding enzyme